MGGVTPVQLTIMKVAMEEMENQPRIFALMNTVSPLDKSDNTDPICFIINR